MKLISTNHSYILTCLVRLTTQDLIWYNLYLSKRIRIK